MPYKKLKVQNLSEEELRNIWKEEYCNKLNPIYTFDNIEVKFYEDMFDHAFFESANKWKRDKSILSLNRLQKMLWIKDTLQDKKALLKKGWDRNNKTYINTRRVAIIKGNYIVIIRITGNKKAKFTTAYEVNNNENLQKILDSPNWKKK